MITRVGRRTFLKMAGVAAPLVAARLGHRGLPRPLGGGADLLEQLERGLTPPDPGQRASA